MKMKEKMKKEHHKMMPVLTPITLNSEQNPTFLMKFYKLLLNKQQKIDGMKFHSFLKRELGDYFADKLFPSIKKHFVGFRHPMTFEEFQKFISVFVNMDLEKTYRLFFNILDQNQDKFICDTDMFENMQHTKS